MRIECVQGIREQAAEQPGSSDQSRSSFQDSDGQGIWKEIHTDTQSTADHGSHSIPFDAAHIVVRTGVQSTSVRSSAFPDFMDPPPLLRPTPGTMLPAATNYYNAVPNTPGQRIYNILGLRGASPTMPTVAHSPQNVNIVSPQLRPLEKSPKRTQLNISSPRLTENGGLTPVVNHLTLSPEQPRPDSDPNVEASTLPPASMTTTRSPVQQVTLSSPAHTPVTSSKQVKKMMKTSHAPQPPADQSPRPSVTGNKNVRSPGRSWKKSFRAASPALATVRDDQSQNPFVRGITREMNNSFQGIKAGANAAAAVNSWRRCGDATRGMVAPALDRETSQG